MVVGEQVEELIGGQGAEFDGAARGDQVDGDLLAARCWAWSMSSAARRRLRMRSARSSAASAADGIDTTKDGQRYRVDDFAVVVAGGAGRGRLRVSVR